MLIVVSGPSGVGKGTVCRQLLKTQQAIYYSVSATTRPPRPGEREGGDYYFVRADQFQQMLAGRAFLEWAEVHGHLYGTPRQPVEEKLAAGYDVLLEIDTQGARQVKKNFSDGIFIFISPPSMTELERRITGRATESVADIQRRLKTARAEMEQVFWYDYLVVNDDVPEAVRKLAAIILAEKCRPFRVCGTGPHAACSGTIKKGENVNDRGDAG